MINLYSEKTVYECFISKKCEGNCCKLSLVCSWLTRATDRTDFNDGESFNAFFIDVADNAVNYCFKKGYNGPLGLNIAMDFNIIATKFGSFSKNINCGEK